MGVSPDKDGVLERKGEGLIDKDGGKSVPSSTHDGPAHLSLVVPEGYQTTSQSDHGGDRGQAGKVILDEGVDPPVTAVRDIFKPP